MVEVRTELGRGGTDRPGLSDWRFARRVVLTLSLAAAALLLWNLRDVLLLLFASVLVGVLLDAAADGVARVTGIPRRWSLTVATLGIAVVLGGCLALFGWQIAREINDLVAKLPQALDALGQRFGIDGASGRLEQAVAGAEHQGVAFQALGAGSTLAGVLADIFLVVVAGIYLAADPRLYRRGVVKLLPDGARERANGLMDATGRALRLWLFGQFLTMCIVGTAAGLTYWLIGLPSPLGLGLIAGLTNFVPFLGPVVAALPPLALAAAADPATVVWTLGATIAIQQLEGNLITPMIQERTLVMPPVVILFSIVVAGTLFGLGGVLLAVPLAAVVTVAVKMLWMRDTLQERTALPGETD